MHYLGEIAALGTAVTWAVCIVIFTMASKRIGSFTMSHYRMFFAVMMLMIVSFFLKGSLLPLDVSLTGWVMLALSGLSGFLLCDTLLFQSCVDTSPRLGILVFNFYPLAGALLAWAFFSEVLSALAWAGIFVAISGTAWVVFEREKGGNPSIKEHFVRGILLAAGACLLQAISLFIAKPAMVNENIDPLTATYIRAIFGLLGFWGTSLVRGRIGLIISKAKDFRSMKLTFIGTMFGASGVWLSMIAIKLAPVGIATTLMAMMPVAVLPISVFIYKEKLSLRAIFGAILACLGVVLLFNG